VTGPDIILKGVGFSYNGAEVLCEIDLAVERRDFLAIIGPNGGGKTTLLNLIIGLLEPDRGSVRVFGEDPARIIPRIGYVRQDTSFNKDFPVSVLDVVLMGRLGHRSGFRRYGREDRDAAESALERVDSISFMHGRIGKLSSGQRQRVFIARALATDPEILVLDEPTASIDMDGQVKIYEILRDLNRQMTVLVVSHDLSLALGSANKVAHVNRTLHVHSSHEFTPELLQALSESSLKNECPVEIIARSYDRLKSPPTGDGRS